jgi:HSP20 family protein
MTELLKEHTSRRDHSPAPLWRATPELDAYESGSEYLIVVDVPGVSAESVDVRVIGKKLSVRARPAVSPGQSDPGQNDSGHIPRFAFERHLELPAAVDSESAVAELHDGVLEIRIQKSASARQIKIPVTAH